VGIAAAMLLLQIAAMGPLRNSFWGLHFYAFLHPAVALLAWVALVGAAVTLFRGKPSFRANDPHWLSRHPVMASVVFAILCGVVFWLLRSQNLFLGDALPLKIDVAKGKDFHPRQPLTMWLQQALYRFLGPVVGREGMGNEAVAQRAVALGSVIAGVLYAFVAAAFGRALAKGVKHGTAVAWLVTLILVTQGFTLLFFGYVENYTFYALAVTLYLWLALRVMQGNYPLLLPGLALVLALLLHLSAAVLVPSFLVLSAWEIMDHRTRAHAVRDLVVCAAVLVAVQFALLALRDYNLLGSLFDVSGRALGGKDERLIQNYMFSGRHLRDFFNEQFLIGPLALFVLVPGVAVALSGTDRRSLPTVFFLAAGVSYLAASWMAGDSNLGYARNWDLLAPAGVCFTAGAMYFVVTQVADRQTVARLLLFGVVISVVHVVPWVWINHSERLALERFKALPLGFGRTETVVANWHLENGRRKEAASWFNRAIEVNPRNGPAHAFLAMLLTQEQRFDEARVVYAKAVALRPDKPEYRHNYVLTLFELGRDEEALPHLGWLTTKLPDDPQYWRLTAQALTRLDRAAELRGVYEQLLRLSQQALTRDPRNADANVEAGILLMYLDRDGEAIPHFRRALETSPDSPAALLNLGAILVNNGRPAEAQPMLRRFLQLYPNHPNAEWARQNLQP
jgi:Flp pilus assembly protein TadD